MNLKFVDQHFLMEKIVIICTQLEAGGAQRAAIRLAEYFRAKNIHCENWFLYKKRDVFKDVPHVKIIFPDKINSVRKFFKFLGSLYLSFKEYRPDAVLTFGHNANIIAQFIAFLSGIKKRVASHRNPRWGYMSTFQQIIDYLWSVLGVYRKITAVSKSTKDSFSNYPSYIFHNIQVIENGFDFEPSQLNKEDAKAKLNLPQNIFLVGNVGRLSFQKNQKILINAIAKLDEDIHLTIAGEGELREELVKYSESLRVQDRVHFLGEIAHDKMPIFYKAIDLFAMPSRFEGLSNALVEAMSSNIPVVCSSIDAQKDVIVDKQSVQSGILLPLDKPEKWADAIQQLKNNPEKYSELKESSKSRSKDFTIEEMGNSFLKVITDN